MVLKNDRLRDKEKKKEIESLLGSVAEERFALLVNLGKKITDWGTHEERVQGDEAMETIGVNVQFDESDDDADNEDVYGEERIQDEEDSEGVSSDEETEAQRRAIQADAVSRRLIHPSIR